MTTRSYEAMFLLDNQAAQADWDATSGVVDSILQKHGATVVQKEKWDERKLAYEIKGQRRATYYLVYFDAPPASLRGIDEDLGDEAADGEGEFEIVAGADNAFPRVGGGRGGRCEEREADCECRAERFHGASSVAFGGNVGRSYPLGGAGRVHLVVWRPAHSVRTSFGGSSRG